MLFYTLHALIGYLTGIYFLYNCANISLIVICILSGVFILALSFVKKIRTIAMGFLVFSVFMILGNQLMHISSDACGYTDEFVTVTGRISEIPYKSNDVWCYTLSCEDISFCGKSESFKKRISFYSENEYKLDDSVQAEGFLELHDREKNPGCFNAYTYYKSVGIDYKLTSYEDSLSHQKIKSYSLYSAAMRVRNKICEIVDEKFTPDNAAILKYILAGFKKDLDRDYTNRLQRSGISRGLYSPYFHMTLILSFAWLAFGNLKTRNRRMVICVLCVLYLCVNPYLPSGRKLFTYIIISEFLKDRTGIFRPMDAFRASILICGLQNPYLLYNEGFLMSCFATYFIIIFFKKIYETISWINKYKSIVRGFVLIVISCVLLLPITAFLFDGTSLYSISISFLLLPVICTVYIISPLLILEGGFFGAASLVANNLTAFIRNLPIIIEKFPFSYLMLQRPPVVLISAYIFGLWAMLERKRKKSFNILVSAALGLVICFAAGEVYRFGKPTVQFLSAGQGDCSVIDIPYKCTVMVDGGGNAEYISNYDVGERDVLPYLRYRGIDTIDYVFISHYHKDHCEGIISLIDNIKIKNIFLPDYLPETDYRVIIEEKARKRDIKLHYISGPEVIELDGGIRCEILYFDKNTDEENDQSVVMRISYDELTCLYTGDITKTVEEKLLKSGADLSADILKVAHHGSATSSSEEFLKKVNPKLAVAMHQEDNTYGFPARQTVQNMENTGIEFITTALGCVEVKERNGQYIWQRKTH